MTCDCADRLTHDTIEEIISQYLSTTQAAERLSMRRTSLAKAIQKRRIQAIQMRDGRHYICPHHLEHFQQTRRRPGRPRKEQAE